MGSAGTESGCSPRSCMMRWARRKLRKREASSRSWRKRRRKTSRGRSSHAIESVTAVKTQLSSPRGERRSFSWPGKVEIASSASCSNSLRHAWRRATRRGVVRQQVNRSAGSKGLEGKSSSAPHAARMMISSPSVAPFNRCGSVSCSASNASITRPALEQSSTSTHGVPIHCCRLMGRMGTYCVYARLNAQISPERLGRGTP
mmetsp:Transcript_4835/g.11812  ORF Transcript_4835/g.11812 Transcript_4835/m.11812 type:complete len:202 (+) Transcript_4835:597-1202(+)